MATRFNQSENRWAFNGQAQGSVGGYEELRGRQNHSATEREEELVICIPQMTLQVILPRLFHNKIVLPFVGTMTKSQVDSWIKAFNESSPTKL